MDYEKKYKEALKMAKGIIRYYKEHNRSDEAAIEDLEGIFPELKESDDERIRKQIIYAIKELHVCDETKRECIAWLEKQGEQPKKHDVCDNCDQQGSCVSPCPMKLVEKQAEQKPDDKVEPKFKVGDYVVGKYISGYISEVRDDCYLLDYQGFPIDKQDNYHLWTIEDAKDGDILVDGELPFIFKRIDNLKHSYAYCGICIDRSRSFQIESEGELGEWTWTQDIKPATKEQRDLLFKKMKEAGYEWNAEKKELKKVEQPSAWSEKDEEMLNHIICDIESLKEQVYCKTLCDEEITWLKLLKDRYTT